MRSLYSFIQLMYRYIVMLSEKEWLVTFEIYALTKRSVVASGDVRGEEETEFFPPPPGLIFDLHYQKNCKQKCFLKKTYG